MRLIVAFVLILFVFGQFCVATPAVAADIVRRSESVLVQRPARIQNVPVARLGVPFMFQLDPQTFIAVDSDSGAPSDTQLIVTLNRDSDTPKWINFNPDNYVFSGTPDAVSEDPFRIRLVATAPGSGDQEDTAFDLYVSNRPPPYLVNTLEYQQSRELMHLVNASYLAISTGVWVHPGAPFMVQMQPFCNRSSENPSLFYSAYHPSNVSMEALPQWLHFNNNTLSLTGTAPIETTSIDIVMRCSNVFGAGGPEQRLGFEVAEHMLELDGTPLAFQLAPGYMFIYNFEWIWSHLYLDGKLLSRLDPMRLFNGTHGVLELDASNEDIGISFSLDKYPCANRTIYGKPPITPVLPQEFPSVPLNISCRGREILTEIPVYSLAASAWHPYREVSAAIPPGRPYSHNFTLDLLESVASSPQWDVFIRIDDPLNSTSWLTFNTTTHILYGTAPMNSPSRDISILLTSNAWGFNTSIPYTLTINNPNYSPPTKVPEAIWSPTVVALLIALAIALVLLVLSIFVFCGLRNGWLVSPFVLTAYHRKQRRSSQTLVDSSSDLDAGCCGVEIGRKPNDLGNIQVHVEKKVGTRASVLEAPHEQADRVEDGTSDRTVEDVEAATPGHSFAPSPTSDVIGVTQTISTGTHVKSAVISSSPIKVTRQRALNKRLNIFKKRKTFGNNASKKAKKQKRLAAAPLTVKSKDPPFAPMWKGHVYQTPEVLQAEERAWQARRLERKARLKREHFARKQAEAQGIYTDSHPDLQEENDQAPKPGAPRRFGIFEQLAKMEDLDRRGPVNMRGSLVSPSRLVEIGENRFFDDTMLDRSEVGSSEFSSLASWETLSESSLPNMVLCYGQLGRRKTREGTVPCGPRPAVNLWAQHLNHDEELGSPGPIEDALNDENILNRIARSLGSENSLNEATSNSELREGEIRGTREEMANSCAIIAYSPPRWKGKAVARGEHGSPLTSQHSPTFKKLARQRFRASFDNNFGSPLSQMAVARTLTYASPSSQSVGSISRPRNDLSSLGSMNSAVFHVNAKGIHIYFIPASTEFCFTVRTARADVGEQEEKFTFGHAKTALYRVQMEDSYDVFMPFWLNFSGTDLEFWGQTPDTLERLQYSMRIVHRSTGEVVDRLSIIVTPLDDLANDQTSLGHPRDVLSTPRDVTLASPSSKSTTLSLAYSPRIFGARPRSSRSIAASLTGTDLSPSVSMTSVVFYLKCDDVHLFVIPAATKFCFEAPISPADGEPAATQSTFGRAVASPYSIQLEECDIISIPPWLHFVPQTMEFWGEAPNVDERLHIAMRFVYKLTSEVVGRITIIVAHTKDFIRLQDELDHFYATDERLSVVEEVSSLDSDELRDDLQDEPVVQAEPQTPKRPRNGSMTVSSSRRAGSWRCGRSPSSRRSIATPPSRRSLGLGTPLSKSGQRRTRTPMSGRLAAYEDYDSVIFEGRSYYSESLCGPELCTLAGNGASAIPNGALDAMSRAASREGSVRLSLHDSPLAVVPTIMDGVEYFVIPTGVDFRFVLQVATAAEPGSHGRRRYDVLVEEPENEEWKFPEWLRAVINPETGAIEVVGSTHDVGEQEKHALIIYGEDDDEELKRVRVVVAPDISA